MSDNRNAAERHGCIVCGRMYDLLVVYDPAGRMVDCAVTSMGGRRVPDAQRPLVACERHAAAEVEAAVLARYPGRAARADEEED